MSDLVLHFLLLSDEKDARLKWVRFNQLPAEPVYMALRNQSRLTDRTLVKSV